MHRRLQNSLSSTKIVFFFFGGGGGGGRGGPTPTPPPPPPPPPRGAQAPRVARTLNASLLRLTLFFSTSLGQTFRLTARAFLNYAKMRAVLQYKLKINSLLDLNLITMSMCYYLYV